MRGRVRKRGQRSVYLGWMGLSREMRVIVLFFL
jgi:hypothetical protein